MYSRLICIAGAILIFSLPSLSQTPAQTPVAISAPTVANREVPAKSIPVPSTVSSQMQAIIAQPLRNNWDKPPTTPEGWKQLADSIATNVAPQIPAMADRMGVKIEPSTINGVRTYTITPNTIAKENKNRLAIHVHGGCYVLNPREASLPEAIFMAGFAHMKVISVDYRMPP